MAVTLVDMLKAFSEHVFGFGICGADGPKIRLGHFSFRPRLGDEGIGSIEGNQLEDGRLTGQVEDDSLHHIVLHPFEHIY